jgi:U4/U6.U5 tri-snRNP-associated protein 2
VLLLGLPQVYCLPDNYEVVDRSLDDVRYMLNPRFTSQDVARLDKVGKQPSVPSQNM